MAGKKTSTNPVTFFAWTRNLEFRGKLTIIMTLLFVKDEDVC